MLLSFFAQIIKFILKLINPNYKLIKIDCSQIESLNLNNSSEYNWSKLERNLKVLGYIPNITVNLLKRKPDYIYQIIDGSHRFKILSKTEKSIKVWVNKKRSEEIVKVNEINTKLENKIKSTLEDLEKSHTESIKNSSNFKRIKNKI